MSIAAGALFVMALIGGAAAAAMEARRAEWERQRALASQAMAEASQKEAQRQAAESERQRSLAEAQRHRAEMERAAAETERQRADRGFEQVRQLSGKFLLDFHDAIADLPGSTPARKMAFPSRRSPPPKRCITGSNGASSPLGRHNYALSRCETPASPSGWPGG